MCRPALSAGFSVLHIEYTSTSVSISKASAYLGHTFKINTF